jgi:hypothetical protein
MTMNYDYSHDISDDDWPGSHMLPRPGQHVSPRTQTMINAESGERLGDLSERAAADAARHVSIRHEHVDQAHPSARPMLRHVFGLNLPGRGPA